MDDISKKGSSKKHHYLPRHYLKGFTDNDGCFYVYDKIEGRIFYSNPDASFFGNNLNTVVSPRGSSSTFLEGLYTDMENHCWPAFDRIRSSNSKMIIERQDIVDMAIFISSLYWRLPSNITIAERWSELAFSGTSPVDYFTLQHKSGGVIPEETVEAIRGSEAFKKSFRVIIAMAPFLRDKECPRKLQDWRFAFGEAQKRFCIVGDNPQGSPHFLCDSILPFPLGEKVSLTKRFAAGDDEGGCTAA